MSDPGVEIACEGCGESVILDPRDGPATVRRDESYDPWPGQVTIIAGGRVVHQCAEGTFSPPE